MNVPFWRLSVDGEFSSSHALRNYNGKCENQHGHNFLVTVVVEGCELTEDTNILLDFKILKTELRSILEQLDHKDLNLIEPFIDNNPSSENIARYIHLELSNKLIEYPVKVYSVTVGEKPGQSATYYGM